MQETPVKYNSQAAGHGPGAWSPAAQAAALTFLQGALKAFDGPLSLGVTGSGQVKKSTPCS